MVYKENIVKKCIVSQLDYIFLYYTISVLNSLMEI